MKGISLCVIFISVLIIGVAELAFSWPWNVDMYDQPTIKPQVRPISPPDGSIPVSGGERKLSREEASKYLKNPIKMTDISTANGKLLFQIYCAICHGTNAKGNGPVAKKFVPPPDITSNFFKKRSDRHIYTTISKGSAVMPSYGENLLPKEIWDIVNYLRRLQE